jgi:hypothetical protein
LVTLLAGGGASDVPSKNKKAITKKNFPCKNPSKIQTSHSIITFLQPKVRLFPYK